MGLGRHRNRRICDARRQLGYGIPRSRGDHQNIQQPLGTDGLHRRDVTKHLMPCQILQPLHQVIRGPEAGIREGGDLRRDRDDCLIQLHQLLQLRQHLFMGAEGAAHRKSDPFFSHTGSPRSFKM